MRLTGKPLKGDDSPWPGWPERTRTPNDREAQIQALVDGQAPSPPHGSWTVTAEVIEIRSNNRAEGGS